MRFDMGTRCGAQYVDIQVVPLPGPRSGLRRQLQRHLHRGPAPRSAPRSGPRDAIVLADGLSGAPRSTASARRSWAPTGEVHGAANVHNRGGLTSVLFTPRRRRRPGRRQVGLVARGHAARDDAQPRRRAVGRAALHRAARPVAARSTATAGRAPTSCATSRTPAPRTRCRWTARALPGAIPENYDCGRDDYFNPAPGRRLLPGHALEHVRLGASWRRAARSPRPAAAATCGSRPRRRPRPAPTVGGNARRGTTWSPSRARGATRRSGYSYQWQHLTEAAGRTSTARPASDYVAVQRRPRAAPARDRGRDQRRRQRERRLGPDAAGRRARASTARASSSHKQGRQGEGLSRPRRRPRSSQEDAHKKRTHKKKRTRAGRAQWRGGRVAARQAHPRLPGPAGPELLAHGRPDRRAHRRGRDGAGAQPPRGVDGRRGRTRPVVAGRRRASPCTSAARWPRRR